MTTWHKYSFVIAALLTAHPQFTLAQDSLAKTDIVKKPDLPLEGQTEKLTFTVDEGTWISLDITPDGQSIIFELLGDLYRLPAAGGDATAITRGLGYDSQPRVSPDGKHIVFISDRKGNDNVWITDIDGQNPRQLTSAKRNNMVSPDWSADGNYIIVTQVTDKTEIKLYHKNGGSGVSLSADDKDALSNGGVGAAVSSDGTSIYFSAPTGQTYPGAQIMRFDQNTGRVFSITQGEGGGLRPALSPDGKNLAYLTRDETTTRLRLRNLETGEDTELAGDMQRDAQENGRIPSRDYFPGYTFAPDGRSIITTKDGKIIRINLSDKSETPIPFSAKVDLDVGPDLAVPYKVEQDNIDAQIVHSPQLSPDNRRIAASILGKIYTTDAVSGGTPKRLTPSNALEFNPVWSPDGRSIAFVTWSDIDGGHVWSMNSNGRGKPQRLTRRAAFYTDLDWSPDGKVIVAMRGNDWVRGQTFSEFGGLDTPMEFIHLPSSGGTATSIRAAKGGERDPHFAQSSDRVFVHSGKALTSMTLDGEAQRERLIVEGPKRARQKDPSDAEQIILRPSGDYAAAIVNNQVWVMPMPPLGAAAPTVNVRGPALPAKRLTDIGADFIDWSDDGKQILWAIGSTIYSRDFDTIDFGVSKPEDKKDDAKEDETNTEDDPVEKPVLELSEDVRVMTMTVTVPRATPEGAILLTNANVVTMTGATTAQMTQARPDTDILIVDNRIEAIGDNLEIPRGAKTYDMAGKTIIPGFIDTHAHWEFRTQDVLEPHSWSLAANLAYGVTSGLDVQTSHKDYFTYRDFVDTGLSTGQRAFMTGRGVFSNTNFESYERTLAHLKRYTQHYETPNIKSYLVGNRQQRQWIVRASKELGLMPTTEGGADMKLDITHAIDGMHGNEHTLPILPLRKDVIELYARTQTAYTATLVVQYQAPSAIDYFFTRFNPHDDEKLARFYPENRIDALTRRRRAWARDEEYGFKLGAESAAALQRAGGLVGIGGHGELQGLGYHWEMQAHSFGGMTPAEILRAATIDGAKIIGIAQDLGSLETGKLADLVILNSNPLDNIANTTDIAYVMKNGELYEGDTLTQIWPKEKPLAPFWWTK